MNRTIAIVFTLLALASCSTVTNVSYFQDTVKEQSFRSPASSLITLQPNDQVSILVNTKDPKLSALFNLAVVQRYFGAENNTSSTQGGVCAYTVNEEGCIIFPVLGKIKVAGLTRSELVTKITNELESRNLVKDPVVTVDFANLSFSIVGEVSNPGRYSIKKDDMTIVDAISMGGDLTIFGRRDNVRLIRNENGEEKVYYFDLRSASSMAGSPAFYVHQNDMIYVEPNKMRARQATVNGNNVLSVSFWISIASLTATLLTTFSVLGRK